MVEEVDGLRAELERLLLEGGELLRDAQIRGLETGTAEAANLAVAEGADTGLGDGAGIQPVVARVEGIGGALVGGLGCGAGTSPHVGSRRSFQRHP